MTEMYDNINAIPGLEEKRYLEIGLYEGFIFGHIKAAEKYGIDIDTSKIKMKRTPDDKIFKMTSDQFFTIKNIGLFDVIFIDGAHDFETVLKDYNNSVKHLNKDGYIFLHDTYPLAADQAIPELCGTAYKICYFLAKQKQPFVFCRHSMEGLGEYPQAVIKNPKSLPKPTDEIINATWDMFIESIKGIPLYQDNSFIAALDRGQA